MKSEGFKEPPEFFKVLEEKFVNSLMEMGFDYQEVKDFIEDKGLSELRHELLMDGMHNPRFLNPLYQNFKQKQEQPQFEYFNPEPQHSIAPRGMPV